jgi:hypothetical protein
VSGRARHARFIELRGRIRDAARAQQAEAELLLQEAMGACVEARRALDVAVTSLTSGTERTVEDLAWTARAVTDGIAQLRAREDDHARCEREREVRRAARVEAERDRKLAELAGERERESARREQERREALESDDRASSAWRKP